ncbi:hypothetical protein Ga0123462_1665 [Mariprofundus ferrinatatus]|uniref:Uncharacterized protein n=1 Tax=Mariprofundus ferrinatatus TaxID=1921087 RepID=A0A2K8L8F2_9PROT|nr:hypothetical protein Ga0123462_1665 [Mariprofundus ferrinatatus]
MMRPGLPKNLGMICNFGCVYLSHDCLRGSFIKIEHEAMEVIMKVAEKFKSENWALIIASVIMIGLVGVASTVL